ncbi:MULTISPECIES: LysR family substrate-binding domain-containing protein [Prauserella salsuginis group]|uniref:LysR family substrate-binding domain-containing protein n=1 Tax=Prauserella salsuginis TaxID=387889 RepID=A0ABW6G9G3_9PSEU|nr:MULTISPECIES: LysR family substrate-binding domain-containing protein [Prauserella salsuginis group]MCR3721536.1 LysR substrate binding domain-containing protein [Prauserella flava]MCR3734228.1 LysR substrate binding domain-containing protein [Prauserella salsuginis]
MTTPDERDEPQAFRLAYVPGVIPDKWVRKWGERVPDVPLQLDGIAAVDAADHVREGHADAVLLRLPTDRTGLHAIPLYTETTVVVVEKEHLLTVADELSVDDLADDVVLHPHDDTLAWEQLPGQPAIARPDTTAGAIELVAAGVGVLAVPQSLARLHHRKSLTYRPLTDAPQSQVALSWPEGETTDLMEEFIGIVRGRTVNSTRGRGPTPKQPKRATEQPTGGTQRGRAGNQGKRGGDKRSGGRGGGTGGGGKRGSGGKGGRPRRR